MREEPTIAIVGATGVIGSELISVLNEIKAPVGEVRLLASSHSEGEVYGVLNEDVPIEVLDEAAFQDVDIAIFAVSPELAREHVPHALAAGARVIDTSASFRSDPDVPLIVPRVNGDRLPRDARVIASPAPCVVQLAPILHAVDRTAVLRRVVVTTLHSVSGAGKQALDELWDQTRAVFRQSEIMTEVFQHQIAFNCIPQIDVFLANGETKEEVRIVEELRKVLGAPELHMTVTAVRVPIFHGDSISINIETERDLEPDHLAAKLAEAEGIEVLHSYTDFPMPLTAAGGSDIYVGRIRKDGSAPHAVNLWSVTDNIRAAALNAAGILLRLIEIG